MTILDDARFEELLRLRAASPEALFARAASRERRPMVRGDGNVLIVAFDHPARRILGVGNDPLAMADRREALDRCIRALRRPGVDGLLATPDVVEDLLLLGELDDKLVFGSMNRGGLTGSAWELDDRFTGYRAETIERLGLDGGKMLLRLDYDDPNTNATIEACARAVDELADRGLVAMVEPLPARRVDGRARITTDTQSVVEAVSVASALGSPSIYTWLKLPAVDDPGPMLAATTLPSLLLGGDPGSKGEELLDQWRAALAMPQTRGLTAGRSLLFPEDGEVEQWVDEAVAIVHGGSADA